MRTWENGKESNRKICLIRIGSRVHKDHVELPNGEKIDDFYAIMIREAALIVTIETEGNTILKREYRYCYDRTLIEIPAGTFEENEIDGLIVVKRKTPKETGYVLDEREYFGGYGGKLREAYQLYALLF